MRTRLPELAYRRFIANQWTERQGHWLPPGAWQSCVGVPEFTDGERIWIGVDVGGERSSSAVCWVNERLSGRRRDLPRGGGRPGVPGRRAGARSALHGGRGGVRPVAVRPSGPGARTGGRDRRRVPAARRQDDPARRSGCTPRSPNGGSRCRTIGSSRGTRRTPSLATAGGAGGSTSRRRKRTSTGSSRCAWRSTGPRTSRRNHAS